MDEVSTGSEVHQPTVGDIDPEWSADELVAELEYEQARKAWLKAPKSAKKRAAAQETALRLHELRAANRADRG